jgi:hypothetical protein
MTTWPHIVGYGSDTDTRYTSRACVYCGIMARADMKAISIASPPHQTPFHDDVSATFDNICCAARQYSEDDEAVVYSCLNCFNCLTRRSPQSTSLHPMSALWWEITTKRKWNNKSMDARVVKRLCCALTELYTTHEVVRNYYYVSGIFSATQRDLIARIAAHDIADMPALIARHIQTDNNNSIFLQSAQLSEFVRQYTSTDLDSSHESMPL